MNFYKNMTEEDQLFAIGYGYSIWFIIKAGIIPSEEVQLAAINQSRHAIQYMISSGITPSQTTTNNHYLRWIL